MGEDERVTVVETVGLTKVFKDFWGRDKVRAVDDLDLQIRQGEVFGLLGPNGSGKTTTIKLLLGLLHPTRGRARIFDRPARDVAIKSRIGYLPEETRLYQFLDSTETLDFYGRLFKLNGTDRDRRSEALVEMVGLSAAAARPVGQYSKGMARRIGLAQSLINDPDFLILDEPTSGMDPIGTRQIKDLILELKKRGKTILLSSHLLADVEDVCDRVAIMYGGRLLCGGRIDDLLAQEHVTQVLANRLTGDQVDELKRILADRFGSDVLSVGNPHDRLEQFFLRQVEQAQRRLTTSGALGGGQVSDFLRAESAAVQGRQLLDRLTATEESAASPAEPPAAVEPSGEDRGKAFLTDLTGEPSPARTTQAERVADESPVEPQKPRRQIDRSMLDDLAGDPSNESGG